MWRATDGQPMVLPKIAYGRGSRLYDVTGKEYIDGSGRSGGVLPRPRPPRGQRRDQAATRRRRPRLSLQLRQRSDGAAHRARGPPQRTRVHQHDLHDRRFRGRRVSPEGRPPLPLRGRCADPPPLHRPGTLVARQHARRAVGVALQGAARSLRGCARAGVAHLGRQPLPPAGRSGRRRRRHRVRRRARTRDRPPRRRERRRLRVRAGGRRGGWRDTRPTRLRAHGARDLRPPWRADDRRRGDVRHRALWHVAGARTRRRHARRDGHRQGTRRRVRAARRDALPRQGRGRAGRGRRSADRAHVHRAHARLCGRSRRPAHRRARSARRAGARRRAAADAR